MLSKSITLKLEAVVSCAKTHFTFYFIKVTELTDPKFKISSSDSRVVSHGDWGSYC